jgi:hypothetical protein
VIRALESAIGDVDVFLACHPEVSAQIDGVFELAHGFESPYGLELLSKIHGVVAEVTGDDQINEAVRSWGDHNARLFTDHHLTVATSRLALLGWISADFFIAPQS